MDVDVHTASSTGIARATRSACAVAFPFFLALQTSAAGCTVGPVDIAQLAPTSLRAGVIAHWAFDEGSGSVVTDRSGNGHNGVLIGGSWIAGQFGSAVSFDGSARDEINVPSFPQGAADWSVSLWVRLPVGNFPSDYVTLISTENLSGAGMVDGGWEMNARLMATDTFYQFAYWKGPGTSDYVSYDCRCVERERWTHIAGVVDGKAQTLSFYRDAVSQATTSAPQPIKPGSLTLFMGRWQSTDRWLTGALDDVVIYDRALTAQEVLELSRAPYPDLPAM